MARILLISNIFPPTIGGPAIFIDRLAAALSKRGHQVTVVCSGEGTIAPDYDAQRAFKVCRVSTANRYVYEVMIRLVLAWQLFRHRLILVNGLESYLGPIARVLRRRFILKIVGDAVWEQGRNWGVLTDEFDAFQQRSSIPARLAGLAASRQRYLALAKVIVTPGKWLADVVAGWGVERSRLLVIPNGVPLAPFANAQPQRRTAGDLDVVFVGRLTNWKGVETLMLALASLDGVHLTVIGEGPELPLLTALATQLKLGSRLSLVGKMEQTLLHQRLMAAHVLVLPSNYEGLSHTLLEAGAAGLARIASHIGGNAEAIQDQVDGLLVPYGNVEAWRAALARLRDDEELRLTLAQQALAQARAVYGFEQSVDAYADLLEAQS